LVSILSFDHQVLSLVNSVDNHLETSQTQLEVRTILSKTDVVEGHVKKTFLNGWKILTEGIGNNGGTGSV
jgi:hypothetical protein